MVVEVLAVVVVALVALLHLYILVLEMFLWRTPRARAAFGTTPEFADATATLAANQGLYNGFLAAGLIWSLIAGGDLGHAVGLVLLAAGLLAGLPGGLPPRRRILFVRAGPPAIGIVLLLLASRGRPGPFSMPGSIWRRRSAGRPGAGAAAGPALSGAEPMPIAVNSSEAALAGSPLSPSTGCRPRSAR